MLSERRQRILNLVVGAYLESGKPVSSAAIADDPAVEWGPSTVRAELAALEHEGYLGHPHTSAGRVPTDSGYRFYADALVNAEARPGPASGLLDLSQMRREIEQALQETTATLSRMTDLLAIATAPPPSAARIHRIEVLQLQPGAVMVVVIASNGAVTKRMFNFASPVDPGLVEWASSFLNERLAGLALGARMASDRLDDPELGPAERQFLAELADAFAGLEHEAESDLYVEGAARLLSADHAPDLPRADSLMRALERRANLLEVLRSTLDRALGVHVDRRREPGAGAARGERDRRQLRPRLPEPRRRRRGRAAADGLRDRDQLGARGRGRALPILRVGL